MKKVVTVGGLVVDKEYLLLIVQASGLYSIPKGHKKAGETDAETAIRELKEETGILPEIVSYIGEFNRRSTEANGEIVNKTIKVYKMNKVGDSYHEPDEESKWVSKDEAVNNMHFIEEAEFINKHLTELIGA